MHSEQQLSLPHNLSVLGGQVDLGNQGRLVDPVIQRQKRFFLLVENFLTNDRYPIITFATSYICPQKQR